MTEAARNSGAAIPVAVPDLTGNEERYVLEALRSSWISSTGPFLDRFEHDFARLVGAQVALGVSNGTVALHLALETLGVGPGDEVIVPSLTYVATANACRYVGAVPVFVDVDPNTWCLSAERVEDAVTSRTRAIIAVHLYGHPADMDPLIEISNRHDLWLIEDAAEALGGRYRGGPVGSLADVGTFSFYGNKVITSGEGGAVTFRDHQLASRARQLRGQGVDPARRYWFPIVGHNFRLTNLASAILCAQLERLSEMTATRRQIFDAYRNGLDGIPGVGFQPVASWATQTPWLFSITIDPALYGSDRDEVMAVLSGAGIDSRPFFVPIHLLPPYVVPAGSGPVLPVTEELADRGMNLPTFPGLPIEDVDRISSVIRDHARP